MLIHVKVQPNSKRDSVVAKSKTSYIIDVKEPAEENRANIRMISLLSEHLAIPRNHFRIITGHHSPGKIVEILQ
jgi:uncharacterized protein YggU (UPF0235/DUF167 family)